MKQIHYFIRGKVSYVFIYSLFFIVLIFYVELDLIVSMPFQKLDKLIIFTRQYFFYEMWASLFIEGELKG